MHEYSLVDNQDDYVLAHIIGKQTNSRKRKNTTKHDSEASSIKRSRISKVAEYEADQPSCEKGYGNAIQELGQPHGQAGQVCGQFVAQQDGVGQGIGDESLLMPTLAVSDYNDIDFNKVEDGSFNC